MKFIQFIKDYWYLPLFAAGVVAAWALWTYWSGGPVLPPLDKIYKEVSAIKAQRLTRETVIIQGTVEAKHQLRGKYAETIRRLDAEQNLKVKELEDDPVALAKFLDRLG